MTHIIATNGSPCSGWNTNRLVRKAAAGAASLGADMLKECWASQVRLRSFS